MSATGGFPAASGRVDAEDASPRERRTTMRWSADAIRAREQAREEERCRLARELHDDLGQAMTGFKMDLAWLERRLADAAANDDVQDKLRTMSQVVDQCIHTLRSVISELRPQTLDQLGLIPSLEWQIDTFGRRFGLRTHFATAVDSVDIDRGRATAVFRMFQEMLTNVGRHARASRVNVRVELDGNTLVLTVQDNGRGVRSAKTAPSSTGILGMRERAALLNGEIRVTSRPRHGTTVAVRLPLENRRRKARPSDGRVRT